MQVDVVITFVLAVASAAATLTAMDYRLPPLPIPSSVKRGNVTSHSARPMSFREGLAARSNASTLRLPARAPEKVRQDTLLMADALGIPRAKLQHVANERHKLERIIGPPSQMSSAESSALPAALRHSAITDLRSAMFAHALDQSPRTTSVGQKRPAPRRRPPTRRKAASASGQRFHVSTHDHINSKEVALQVLRALEAERASELVKDTGILSYLLVDSINQRKQEDLKSTIVPIMLTILLVALLAPPPA